MTEALDLGYPLVVLAIAAGLAVLGYVARHVSRRMIEASRRARGPLPEAEPHDRPLREALEFARAGHRT